MNKIIEHSTDAMPADIRQLSDTQFAELGMAQVAYIKPVVVEGKKLFAIHAANGTPMALAEDRDVAVAAVHQHDMTTAPVH